jgi:Ca-activated chloride channel homolog
MSFARPDLIPFAVIVPLLLALAIWLYARRRRRIAAAFSDPHLIERLGGQTLLRFPARRVALLALAGACLALAAAGPRWGVRSAEGRALSLNVVITTDISRSMLAEDVEPNRLERARLLSRRLLRELPGDRFGLVVFAGRAYTLSPLTVDHSALELYIDALDPAMVSQGGSSIASALTQATDLVRGSEEAGGDRVIVLLSDGEALEDDEPIREAIERTARAGVRVMTVGFGTTRGATVPVIDESTGEVIGQRRDEYGDIVITRLDERLLREIASRTGGSYMRADDAAALTRLVGELRGMQRGQGENAMRLEPRERYALFAAVGLLLLLLDTLLAHGRAFGRTPSHGSRNAIVRASGREEMAAVAAPRAEQRRPVRAALMVLLLGTGLGFGIGDLERGNRMYREGRYEEAVEAYVRVIESGRSTPQVHYNLGTALLALGRYQEAERALGTALQGVDPALRQSTFYNLGNRFLQEGRAEQDPARQGGLLDAAIEAYRRALRVAPGDTDAKWNLELALRERERNEQRQSNMPQRPDDEPDQGDSDERQDAESGGGSGASQSPSPAGDGADAGTDTEQRPMSQEDADRILSAIEQDERELTRERLRRGQRQVPVLRDW